MAEAPKQACSPEGGVLSRKDIVAEQIIKAELFDKDQLQPAAYNLRIGHIITSREYVHWDGERGRDLQGRTRDALQLKPGETATLATLEELELPAHVNGLIVPRDGYAKKGLLTLNAGHVDPGHKGFVTAQVVNLTDRPFSLHLYEAYFSIVLFYVHCHGEPREKTDPSEKRLRDLRFQAAQAPVSLVQKETLEKVFVSKNDLTFELLRRMWILVLGLTALSGLGVGIWQLGLILNLWK